MAPYCSIARFTRFETVSLIDLALLADDPSALARMLIRLTDGEGADDDALTQRYSDVATLFAAMDPKVARVMFAKLDDEAELAARAQAMEVARARP